MDWFLAQGKWLVVVLAIAAFAYWALRRWMPKAVWGILHRTMPWASDEDLERTHHWLTRFLHWLAVIGIVFAAVVGILPRFGIDVSAITRGLRIGGEVTGVWLGTHGTRILLIVVIAVVIHQIGKRVIPRLLEVAVGRREVGRPVEEIKQRAGTLSGFLVNGMIAIIWVIAAFMILAEFGLDIAPLLVGAGVIGIAIGFGAQSLIRDALSGFFIIMENQYGKGDWIKISNIVGEVEDVGIRRTILRDLDGVVHIVPNGEVRTASNMTKEWARVNLDIPVAYSEDLDHAIEVINRVCREMSEEEYWRSLLLSTPQVLRVDSLGDSRIEIKILGETKPLWQWAVMGELRKRIKKTFDEEGIEIPWPHMKVYFGDGAMAADKVVRSGEDVPLSYRRRVPRKRTYGHRRRYPGGSAP